MSLDTTDELWLSEEDEDEYEDENDLADPKYFDLSLTYQGPPGDFHTRNRPGQRQRQVVSDFGTGRTKHRSAYQVGCEAKVMIHGRWGGTGPDSHKWATLLVYQFEFHSYRGRRLKAADIRFEFQPMRGQSNKVFVAEIRPDRVFKVERTEQTEHSKHGLDLTIGAQAGAAANASITISNETEVEKVTAHHTVITGDKPADIYGDRYEAHFSLTENQSQEDGIPTRLTTCILLKRDTEGDFVCVPYIHVTPDFKTMVGQLFSSRDRDDPIWFSPSEPAFNQLEGRAIDPENLGATCLDQLWDCTMYTQRAGDDIESYLWEPEQETFSSAGLGNEWQGLSSGERLRKLMQLLATGARWESLDPQVKQYVTYRNPMDQTTPTVLHHLSLTQGDDTYEFYQLHEETRTSILAFLLEDHLQPDRVAKGDYPVLARAFQRYNLSFLTMISTSPHLRSYLPGLLQASHLLQRQNSLHLAFRWLPMELKPILMKDPPNVTQVREKLETLMRIIREWINEAPVTAITARDTDGNTPLHYGMRYVLCYYLNPAGQTCQTPVDFLFNNDDKSPYLTYLETKVMFDKKRPRSAPPSVLPYGEGSGVKKSDRLAKENRPDLRPEGRIGTIDQEKAKQMEESNSRAITGLLLETSNPPTAVFPLPAGRGPPSQLPPVQNPIRQPSLRPQKMHLPGGSGQDPKSVAAAAASSSGARSPVVKPVTVTMANEHATRQTLQVDNEGPKRQAADSIRQYLRLHYIRTRSDMDAKNLLYGKIASDKNLYFDASHLRGREPAQVVHLIRRLGKAGGFEDTLSYVKIPLLSEPYWLPEQMIKANGANAANDKRPRKSTPGQDKSLLGRNALVAIFDELAAANVRTILRLQVEDNGDELAHSDTAIERAIKGRDLPDISIDVIIYAAPTIKHLHLHWGGSQTVLRGWTKGILELYKPRKRLSSVNLHIYQVQVDTTHHKGRVVTHMRADDESHHSLDTSDVANETQYRWVTRMEEFRDAMHKMHEALKEKVPLQPPRVKVALIDDGLDYGDFDVFPHTEVRGLSCYPGIGQNGRPWHESTKGHGTAMANMILRINPWIHLLVIRIEDGISYAKPGLAARTINPNSVAHAIEMAIIHKVDIISMSWTVRKRMPEARSASSSNIRGNAVSGAPKKSIDEQGGGIGRLETAIKQAATEDILMVCAAADDIELLGKDTLPYSAAMEQIFRIGACNSQAQRDPGSENARTIAYFLPGIQVAEARRPNSLKPIVYHDGSSISTALAAGLMSMILHCVRYMAQCHEVNASSPDGSSPYGINRSAGWGGALRRHNNMRAALRNIVTYSGPGEQEDPKQLPVWRIFGDTAQKLNDASGVQKVEKLWDLVAHLCHGLEN
ncbi:hypothetical protein ASPZODRAFT_154494 [Penicilliopsis zonata CBS 506.65]|uniref:Peptidase S8/S53 domain-containing protein n=1 Tax=Penicilliopsis zonata CBS 506.65 TaxID=1073090 RepID=A0A1L9S932_9EURO|nr:hypothetical protein ASPZODRAFT_154494 [Penicilliopsis zonata CBS 506.65]OJJ43666.1 hypothetical protein ASPZODRAFT_154494 [Penicilliopsis zonata CBS 506.65]